MSSLPAAVRSGDAPSMSTFDSDLTADEPEPAATADDLERIRRRLMRLAFDVHDGPLQSLTAAGFGLKDLQERLNSLPLDSEERDAA